MFWGSLDSVKQDALDDILIIEKTLKTWKTRWENTDIPVAGVEGNPVENYKDLSDEARGILETYDAYLIQMGKAMQSIKAEAFGMCTLHLPEISEIKGTLKTEEVMYAKIHLKGLYKRSRAWLDESLNQEFVQDIKDYFQFYRDLREHAKMPELIYMPVHKSKHYRDHIRPILRQGINFLIDLRHIIGNYKRTSNTL